MYLQARRFGLILFALSSALWAQNYQGSLRGIVSDQQNAAVANAKVTLTDQGTNAERSTVTNATGEYVFSSLNPATYSIVAESPNFKRYVRRDVIVATQSTVTADVQLEVGTQTQTVEVNEETPMIETGNASNGQVLDTQKLTDLPNLGRNPFLMSKLSTNVTPVGDPRFNRFQDQSGSSQISIAGGPVRGNNYLVDGVPITDSNNRAVIIPSIEGTQEMKLQENTYDATMGRTGGGVFNTLLKSGSNSVHGSALGYTRQTDWVANDFFSNRAGRPKQNTPFYNWGFSFGGPVVIPKIYNGRNKSFFYLTTESYRQKSPLTDQYILPTAAQKAGNFAASRTIYDPLTSRACTAADKCPTGVTTVRTPFAGNIISPNRINPVGANILRLLPSPQTGVVDGVNFNGVDTLTDRADEYIGKFDQEVLPWWKVNLSYMRYKSQEPGGNTLGSILAASNASPFLLGRKVDATQINSIMTLNPTTVLSLRFGFNRFPNVNSNYNIGASPAAVLGLPASYASQIQAQSLPQLDFNNFSVNNASPGNSVFYSRSFLVGVSKFVGRHNLSFGSDYRAIHTDFFDLTNSAGQFAFNGVFTQQYPTAVNNSGLDYADVLLGVPSSGAINTTTKLYTKVNYWAGYIQDDFRVNNKLTLNLGLRYEFETGIKEANSAWVVGFDGSALNPLAGGVSGVVPRGVLQYARTNGNGAYCCNPSKNKWGPRVGFAYQLNSKTTIRGGAGIFYAPIYFTSDASLAVGYTNTTTYVASNDNNATPANSLSNPFPNGIQQPVGNTLGGLTSIGSSIRYIDQNRSSGVVYQYSFDIQRELYKGVTMEVGYIGSRSTGLQTSSTGSGAFNINQVPNQYLGLGSALSTSVGNPYYPLTAGQGVIGSATVAQAQLLKPYSQYNAVNIMTNPSSARYNSFIAKAQKRMSAGITFLSAFTWSKNMSNEFATGNFFSSAPAVPQNAYNLGAEWGLANGDTPLRWTNTLTYELPFGKGKMLLGGANKITDLAIGGWQVNFTNVYQTGFPLLIAQNTNLNAVLGTGVQRPNATGISPFVSGSVQSRLNGYINTPAFAPASAFTFGNVSRTINYRGPGTKSWDISLFKNFAMTEKLNAEFRAEALNAFNTPQFPNPNSRLGSGSFGIINSQVNFARLIQLGVRVSF